MTKLPVALQLYSVRDAMEKDFAGTINAVAKMGYAGVEFAGVFGKTAEEVKNICKNAEICPISAHVPYDDMKKDAEGIVKFYSEIGVTTIVVPWLGEEYRPGQDGYAEFCDVISKMTEISAKYDIKICYHNHDFEFETLNGEYLLDIIYKDNAALFTQIDTCWAHVGMGDPAGYLRKFTGRAPTVHLKDYVGEKTENMYALIGKDDDNDTSEKHEAFELRPVGYGKQDFKEIIAAAEEIGSKWLIVEQDQASMGKSSLECAQMSIDWLKNL